MAHNLFNSKRAKTDIRLAPSNQFWIEITAMKLGVCFIILPVPDDSTTTAAKIKNPMKI